MPELIDIDPIIICPNSMKCTKRKATVKSPNMVRVQPIVRCPEKLKCPPTIRHRSPSFYRKPGCQGRSCSKSRGRSPSFKSRGRSPSFKSRGRSPSFKSRGRSPTLYRRRSVSPIFKGLTGGRSPSLCHGGIIIIPRN